MKTSSSLKKSSSKILQPNLLYLTGLVIIFIGTKYFHSVANAEDLRFLLYPVSLGVSWITGTEFQPLNNGSYLFETLDIVIDASCAGFGFLTVSILAFGFLPLKNPKNITYLMLSLLVVFACAYGLTVIVNVIRIVSTLYIQPILVDFFPQHQQLIHESIGVFIFLFFLFLTYILLDHQLNKTLNHA